MAGASGRGVVLEVSVTCMRVKLSKRQLDRIRNNEYSASSQVNKEFVSLAIAHAYRSHEYRAGDIYRRTTYPVTGEPHTIVLQGPTEVKAIAYFIINF